MLSFICRFSISFINLSELSLFDFIFFIRLDSSKDDIGFSSNKFSIISTNEGFFELLNSFLISLLIPSMFLLFFISLFLKSSIFLFFLLLFILFSSSLFLSLYLNSKSSSVSNFSF